MLAWRLGYCCRCCCLLGLAAICLHSTMLVVCRNRWEAASDLASGDAVLDIGSQSIRQVETTSYTVLIRSQLQSRVEVNAQLASSESYSGLKWFQIQTVILIYIIPINYIYLSRGENIFRAFTFWMGNKGMDRDVVLVSTSGSRDRLETNVSSRSRLGQSAQHLSLVSVSDLCISGLVSVSA